jgi:hypothetical protein
MVPRSRVWTSRARPQSFPPSGNLGGVFAQNGLGNNHHDNGDGLRCFLCCRHCWVVCCDDDVHLELHQLGRELGEAFGSRMRSSPFNGDVLSLHVAELTQSVVKGIVKPGICLEHANPRNLWQLLRLRSERRGEEHDGGPHDERSAIHHWMIVVACSSTEGGMVKPSA